MGFPKDVRDELESCGELDNASGIWRRTPADGSRALHDARNLVFALKATLVWLEEVSTGETASIEIREGIEDLSAVAERLDSLLTEALGSQGRS
jgi:hypothetical protein